MLQQETEPIINFALTEKHKLKNGVFYKTSGKQMKLSAHLLTDNIEINNI